MKKTINKLFLFALIFSFVACETVDYGDTNVDPNNPTANVTSAILTNAQKSIGTAVTGTTPMLYTQHLSNGQYDEESRYQTLFWNYAGWYSGAIVDLERIIEVNTNPETADAALAYGSNGNQIAIATILQAYFFHFMVDRWGYLPYTQSLEGIENPQPVFDSTQAIYLDLFSKIDFALAAMDDGFEPVGDLMFDGNMARWAQFANTMKMVMAMRLADVDASIGAQMFNQAYGNTIMQASENIYFPFGNDDNSDNPWQDRFETRKDYLMSDTFVDALLDDADPRITKFAEEAELHPGEYIGAPYGHSNSNTSDYSFITSDIIHTQDSPGIVYTYAQVALTVAEAIERGWMQGDAEVHYLAGIEASMAQWGVAEADAALYMAAEDYSGTRDIQYQKWVALYMQGYEGWAEWRRFDFPELTPPQEQMNGTGIPNRQGYPSTAEANNETNYNAAVAAQGADDLDTQLWWDLYLQD